MSQIIPMVSVIMTAFNREPFIAEAIESVLYSTFDDFELIIVDDCSSDTTVEIIREYESIDSRIKLFVNERNLGDYPNRNRAVKLAIGEYIMFVDSDDKILPNGIEKCIEKMLRNPLAEYGIYSSNLRINKELTPREAIQIHFFDTPFLIVGPGGTIQKRKFINSLGGYPEKYGPANDMYYHLKAASKTNIVLLNFDFVYYRRHDGQEINNKKKYLIFRYLYLKDAINELELFLNNNQKEWLLNKNKRRHLVNLMKYFFTEGDIRAVVNTVKLTNFKFRDVITAIFQF